MGNASSFAAIIAIIGNLAAIALGILAIRRWAREGMPGKMRWKKIGVDLQAPVLQEFGVGFGIGAIAMAGLFAVELSTGLLHVDNIAWPVAELLARSVVLLIMAAIEELLFRGFLINGILVLKKNIWLALAVTAFFFGIVHVANPNATAVSVISTMIGGIMYALAFLWTGRLWMPWGLHFAWNVVQGPVLGFHVSGFSWESIVHQTAIGPALLTGGDYGPEGGIIGIAFRLVVIALLWLWKRADASGVERPSVEL